MGRGIHYRFGGIVRGGFSAGIVQAVGGLSGLYPGLALPTNWTSGEEVRNG
ncbi:hypothetical protein ES708_34717 [subsurface metagenome]